MKMMVRKNRKKEIFDFVDFNKNSFRSEMDQSNDKFTRTNLLKTTKK